jgi:cellulose 1,4-beta-cellobiosidase
LLLPGPFSLTASQTADAQITLSWTPSIGATGYNVKRSTQSISGPYTTLSSTQGTTSTDMGLTRGQIYFYVVGAVDQAGEVNSNPVAATPASLPPSPTGVLALAEIPAPGTIGPGGGPPPPDIRVTWAPVPGATGYNVYRATTSGVNKSNYSTLPGGRAFSAADGVGQGSFVDYNLTSGTYYYVVTALNIAGESSESTQVQATIPN